MQEGAPRPIPEAIGSAPAITGQAGEIQQRRTEIIIVDFGPVLNGQSRSPVRAPREEYQKKNGGIGSATRQGKRNEWI